MFSYRTIIKQAWKIAWKNKNLWFLGIFASLAVAGGSLEYEFLSPAWRQGLIAGAYQGLDNILVWSELLRQLGLGLTGIYSQGLVSILNTLTISLLFLTFMATVIWLAISSQAAIVDSFRKILAPAKKKSEKTDIRTELGEGGRHFWPVLWLNILIKLGMFLVFFLMNLPLLLMILGDGRGFIVAYTFAFVIFLPLAVSLSLVIKYAIAFNVLEGYSVVKSLEKGWRLFQKNWLISLEVALLLFGISFVFTFAVLFALSLVFLPLFLLASLFSVYWLAFLMLSLAIIVTILAGAFLSVFQIGSWTNLFLELRSGNGLAKLERIFHRR